MFRHRRRHHRHHRHHRRHRSRRKLSRRHSRKMFSKYASRLHPKNVHRHPMRGGFRI